MLTTIIIFIIILGILVFVHEFGHFIVAKKSGMVVEEFGFGFPPRIIGLQKVDGKWKWVWGKSLRNELPPTPSLEKRGGQQPTIYSINAIPLGGFVRILGENNEYQNHPGSFINKGFWPRFFTLVAGVLMNVILAWVLLSVGFGIGIPTAIQSASELPPQATFYDQHPGIAEVTINTPAEKAGMKPEDSILSIDDKDFKQIPDIQNYIQSHPGQPLNFKILRGSQTISLSIIPEASAEGKGLIGVGLATFGKLKYPWALTFTEGAKSTGVALVNIVLGLYHVIHDRIGLAAIGGPVKIAALVGQARQAGVAALLSLTVMLSLSLAVLNILPIPALDGGRVLFLIIEKLRGKKNNQKVEQAFNTLGFALLLVLMVIVTVHDIIRR